MLKMSSIYFAISSYYTFSEIDELFTGNCVYLKLYLNKNSVTEDLLKSPHINSLLSGWMITDTYSQKLQKCILATDSEVNKNL